MPFAPSFFVLGAADFKIYVVKKRRVEMPRCGSKLKVVPSCSKTQKAGVDDYAAEMPAQVQEVVRPHMGAVCGWSLCLVFFASTVCLIAAFPIAGEGCRRSLLQIL